MDFDLINLKDVLEVPLFGSTIFYISMIKKRNLFENCILYLAIGLLIISLYIVIQNMKNIKENKENVLEQNNHEYSNLIMDNQYENFENNEPVYFIQSNTFNGPKKNYVFTTRDEGTGYYLDSI